MRTFRLELAPSKGVRAWLRRVWLAVTDKPIVMFVDVHESPDGMILTWAKDVDLVRANREMLN